MKKTLSILLTLIIACSCLFAAKFSFTTSSGFSGIITPKLKSHCAGPSFLLSCDYETSFGFSAYEDTTFTFDVIRKYTGYSTKANVCTLAEDIGGGYTFNFKDVSVFVGAGMDIRVLTSNQSDVKAEWILGINTRVKGVYHFSDQWGMCAQLNRSWDFNGKLGKGKRLAYDAMFGCVFTI